MGGGGELDEIDEDGQHCDLGLVREPKELPLDSRSSWQQGIHAVELASARVNALSLNAPDAAARLDATDSNRGVAATGKVRCSQGSSTPGGSEEELEALYDQAMRQQLGWRAETVLGSPCPPSKRGARALASSRSPSPGFTAVRKQRELARRLHSTPLRAWAAGDSSSNSARDAAAAAQTGGGGGAGTARPDLELGALAQRAPKRREQAALQMAIE